MILVVDDDPEIRDLLALILSDDGHAVASAADGVSELALVAGGSVRPALLLTDYNLPNGMDGLAVTEQLRRLLGAGLPSIVLTGDISTDALGKIAAQHCLMLNKPVAPAELRQAIRSLLPKASGLSAATELPVRLGPPPKPDGHVIFVVDDDSNIRDMVRLLLEQDGHAVQDYASSEAFLAAYVHGSDGCLLLDAYLPQMSGLELLRQLRTAADPIPTIMMTGNSDVAMAVQAMKAGAADFIEKPIAAGDVLASIERALEQSHDSCKALARQVTAARHIAGLTPRQHQIMDLVLAGHPSKNIAADLGISQRTVENHRASIMKMTETKSLPALARLALAAAAPGAPVPGPGPAPG
jgi:two-component system CheB/CheR fusion protein